MNITIITASRRHRGLKKVIESIDNQTYQKWHHIIVNSDNEKTREELYNICDMERRFFIDVGMNTGYYGGFNRNIGVMVAFSYLKDREREWDDEWITFLDDDNLWYSDHLETLVKGHKEKPEATLIGVDAEIRGYKNPNYKYILKCQIAPQNCDLGNFLYKKDLFDKYGYFRPRPERKITYDYELIEKIVRGEGIGKIYIVHKPTFIFYHKQK